MGFKLLLCAQWPHVKFGNKFSFKGLGESHSFFFLQICVLKRTLGFFKKVFFYLSILNSKRSLTSDFPISYER